MPGANCIGFAAMDCSTATAYGLDSTAMSLRLPNAAKGCIITIEDGIIRWRADGTAPTTGVGHELVDADVLTFDSWSAPGNNWRSVLKQIEFKATTAASAAGIEVSYFD